MWNTSSSWPSLFLPSFPFSPVPITLATLTIFSYGHAPMLMALSRSTHKTHTKTLWQRNFWLTFDQMQIISKHVWTAFMRQHSWLTDCSFSHTPIHSFIHSFRWILCISNIRTTRMLHKTANNSSNNNNQINNHRPNKISKCLPTNKINKIANSKATHRIVNQSESKQ